MPRSKLIELFVMKTGLLVVERRPEGVKVDWFDPTTKQRRSSWMTWDDVQEAV